MGHYFKFNFTQSSPFVNKLKALPKLVFQIVMSSLVFAAFFSVYMIGVGNESSPASNNLSVCTVPVTYIRLEEKEHHIYLSPRESATFRASNQSEGFKFRGTQIIMNAANRSFLEEMKTDLYTESYDYWDGSLGAWTPNSSFTLTNPISETQELFLKTINRYSRRTYVSDTVNGTEHFITFKTEAPADRVMMNWGFFGALKYLEVNGSQVDVSNVSSFNRLPIMLEHISFGCSFHLPHPLRIHNTVFSLRLEERDILPPPQSPHIVAMIIQHHVITLNPFQEFLFEVPKVKNWTYSYGVFYGNLTPSMYPTPYPFKLVNLAVWNPEEKPVSATPLDTKFGIRNLSNKTHHLSFDTALYYWQNKTGMTFSHQANITETAIYHKICVNVSDADVGAESGLNAQYLVFGSTGKTLSYDAPDPVGRFEDTYIPLKEGSYTLITMEPKIVPNITVDVDDLQLSATLNINVTYDGEPYANAEITVLQKGMVTGATYKTYTDATGRASITVRAKELGIQELDIMITKDVHNFTMQTINVAVGILWILVTVLVVGATILSFLFFRLRRKRNRKLDRPQDQPYRQNVSPLGQQSDNSMHLCFDKDHLPESLFFS